MVKINLSKLIKFIGVVSKTPRNVTKRKNRLIEAYNNLVSDTDDQVSIKMKAHLERFKETHLDLEESHRHNEILEQLIDDYTDSGIVVPESNNFKNFLVPSTSVCLNSRCLTEELFMCRPSRTENSIPIFTTNGVLEGEVYRKVCRCCNAIYYYNYWEVVNLDNQLIRTYYSSKKELYFSTTNETFFEKHLLEQLSEDIVTCNVQFVNWATAYNRLKSNGKSEISHKLVVPAWIIFSTWKRISVSFPVIRDKARNLDIESVCAYLYPMLRQNVDKKWFPHFCSNCSTRLGRASKNLTGKIGLGLLNSCDPIPIIVPLLIKILTHCFHNSYFKFHFLMSKVVMDGDAKAYRTVCSADVEKKKRKGELNEFLACQESPLPGKDKCLQHLNDESSVGKERLDFGMITRAKRKELGISIDVLTTEEGCRKREAITQRTERSKTAGKSYFLKMYWILDHCHTWPKGRTYPIKTPKGKMGKSSPSAIHFIASTTSNI